MQTAFQVANHFQRRALRSWTSGWQQAPESSLDPNNENGPIPFTSSALLGLAYVRIYINLGPYRQLETRDPVRIAKALSRSPRVERSDGVISALLYATHALSIPVRLGVDRVARSQAFFWSVRHSLSGLECAVLLSKWLQSLAASVDSSPLTGNYDPLSVSNILDIHANTKPPPIKTAKTASCIGCAVSSKKLVRSSTSTTTRLSFTPILLVWAWLYCRSGRISSRVTRSGRL